MPLSQKQISFLLKAVAASTPDRLDCDKCFANVSQFAESELKGLPLCESMSAIKNHMVNCPCCQDEYAALLNALGEIEKKCDQSNSKPTDCGDSDAK